MKNFISTTLKNEIKSSTHDFILVGEIHGVEENAKIIKEIIELVAENKKDIHLAFEWTLDDIEIKNIKDFTVGKIDTFKTPASFFDTDGRFTYSHLELLRYIRNFNEINPHQIKVYFFDIRNVGDNPEESLADSLISIKKQVPATLIVETGNFHADKKGFDEESLNSMASILNKKYQVFSVFIKYLSGHTKLEDKLYNFSDFVFQQEGMEADFDETIVVEKATPAEKEIPLTMGIM